MLHKEFQYEVTQSKGKVDVKFRDRATGEELVPFDGESRIILNPEKTKGHLVMFGNGTFKSVIIHAPLLGTKITERRSELNFSGGKPTNSKDLKLDHKEK